MRLAAASIVEGGVIAVDDPFRPEWPGVSEAVFRFLAADPRFCAVAVGFNKLLLVRRTVAHLYVAAIEKKEEQHRYQIRFPWHLKTLPFMDYPLRIFYVPSYLRDRSVRTTTAVFYNKQTWLRNGSLGRVVRLIRAAVR
jgi:hypothetical protein